MLNGVWLMRIDLNVAEIIVDLYLLLLLQIIVNGVVLLNVIFSINYLA